MANKRQSSDRGCTQRGAYRRDFVLKVSQVVKASALLLALFASQSGWAQSFTSNSLVVALTQPPVGSICSQTSGTAFQFNVSGNYVVAASGTNSTVALYASQLQNSGSGFMCPSTPSGTRLGNAVQAPSTSINQQYIPSLTATDFQSPTTATNSLFATICGAATAQRFANRRRMRTGGRSQTDRRAARNVHRRRNLEMVDG